MSPRVPERWMVPGDSGYPQARARLSASSWQPGRYPAAISHPATVDQVCADVRAAADRGLGVAVRSGGHSTSGTHLADSAVTLDLGAFRAVTVDTASATAWIGPGVTALEAARALEGAGLFFPLGHSPTVGLGGFLLAGGNGWNTPEWGHACDRVLAAEVVLADGRRRTIDAGTDPELFALLRGAGPAFPGVVTAFQVALVRARPLVRRLLLTVDGADPAGLGRRLDQVVAELPAQVETTVFWHPARTPDRAPTALVAATSFAATEGTDDLAALRQGDLPVLDAVESAPGPSLLRLIDALPRHAGEAITSHHTWTDAGYAEVLGLLPAQESRLLPSSCVLLTTCAGRSGPPPSGGGAPAYRPGGRLSISPYAHWDPAVLPAEVATGWTRAVIERLQPVSTGRYVGEADLTEAQTTPQECFGRDGAGRLAAGRARFDPDGRLHSPFRFPPHRSEEASSARAL